MARTFRDIGGEFIEKVQSQNTLDLGGNAITKDFRYAEVMTGRGSSGLGLLVFNPTNPSQKFLLEDPNTQEAQYLQAFLGGQTGGGKLSRDQLKTVFPQIGNETTAEFAGLLRDATSISGTEGNVDTRKFLGIQETTSIAPKATVPKSNLNQGLPSGQAGYTQSNPQQALLDFQSGKITADQYNQWAANYAKGGAIAQTTPKASAPASSSTAKSSSTTVAQPLLSQGTGTKAAPNAEVMAIQRQLGITADGIFGPQTKSAIMAFQQQNGLTVDGIVGPQTRAALAKAGGAQTLTQGQSYAGGTVQFSTETGARLAPGETTPATPGNTGGTPGQTTTTSPQAEIESMNNAANEEMEKLLSQFKESVGTSVEVSDSEKLLKALTESFTEQQEADKPKSLTEQLAEKRKELGVDPLETQINDLDAQIAKLDSDFLALQEKTGNRRVSLGQINRRKSAEEIQYSQMKAELNLQRNAIANSLNQKYSVINTFMQYASADYDNAQQAYNTKFTQAINLTNLFKNVEEAKKSDIEKQQDNTKANLQIIMDALKGKDYGSIDAGTKATISKMEAQAGLPLGFTEFVISNFTEDPVISIGSMFANESGQLLVPVYLKNPSTGAVSVQMIDTKQKKQTTPDGKTTLASYSDIFSTSSRDLEGDVVIDENGYVTPKAWKEIIADAVANGINRTDFIKQYGNYLYQPDLSAYGLTAKEKELLGTPKKSEVDELLDFLSK